jgi:hypothetical protein
MAVLVVPVKQGPHPRCTFLGQSPHYDGQVGEWRRNTSLSGEQARLSYLPVQGAMLSKDPFPQDPA